MIHYRTFSDYKWFGWHPRTVLQRWDRVRQSAQDFANQLNDEDIVAITESAYGNSPYGFAVTVWYRQK
ncbi:MAG: hypothetical protein AMJ93_09845 [Anaerolineae bacterium SM23_84]|nr:MAG: hypothetical protein AMJ93_09845 [Anaerolineae bacterium SM23_84]